MLYLSFQYSTIQYNSYIVLLQNSDRPRLIKVTLSSKEEEINILRSQCNLRNKVYQQAFHNTRLNPLQQRRSKQLRTELAELSKINKYYMIKAVKNSEKRDGSS